MFDWILTKKKIDIEDAKMDLEIEKTRFVVKQAKNKKLRKDLEKWDDEKEAWHKADKGNYGYRHRSIWGTSVDEIKMRHGLK